MGSETLLCRYDPSSDRRAALLREELIRRFRYKPEGLPNPQRVYEETVRRAEDEFKRGPDSDWVRFIRGHGVIVPWIFDDGNRRTKADRLLRERVVREIPPAGDSPEGTVRSLVGALAVLNIRYVERGIPEEEPGQFYKNGRALCTGFQYLYAGALLLAGYQPEFYEELLPGLKRHSFVGVRFGTGEGEVFVIDPAFPDPIQGRGRLDGGHVRPTTRLEVMAAFLTNQVEFNNNDGRERGLLRSALRYAPQDPSVYFNVGQWFRRQPPSLPGRDREARACFKRIRELDPEFELPSD